MRNSRFTRRLTWLPFLVTGLLGLTAAGAQADVFQAENYSAYFDTTAGNSGGALRTDNVDIEATQDVGGGYNVGWIEATEWLVYNNLVVPSTGSYTVNMRVASLSGGSASVDLNAGSIVLGSFAIPATGGWQNWATVSKTVTLNAGTYNLGVYAQAGGWNFNWIEVVPNNIGSVVTTYQHCNYGGWAAGVGEGSHTLTALRARGFVNDDASSIRVASGYEAVLYEHDNFAGRSVVIKGDNSCIGSTHAGFNDTVSSMIVRKAAGNLAWSDDFNSINTSDWTFETGGGGWGNNELQYYTGGQNASIQFDSAAGSNVLVLEARRENPASYACWYGRCEYTSTRMVTKNKKTFKYGRIEARLKLPQTEGIWPAFWAMGNNIDQVGWPNNGEIDVMEHVGYEPTLTHGALHGPGYSGNTPFSGTHNLNEQVNANYHVYAVEWNADGISWYVDNTKFYSVTRADVQARGNWAFDNPFFLLLNVAVGGNWPGSPDGGSQFPQRLYVDYVRGYQ